MNLRTLAAVLAVVSLVVYILLNREFESVAGYLIRYFPEEPDKTEGFYMDLVRISFVEILWVGLFCLIFFFLSGYHLSVMGSHVESTFVQHRRLVTLIVLTLFIFNSVSVVYSVLDTFPNSSDEYVYLFQSETLAENRLWYPAHPLSEFFTSNNIAVKGDAMAGRFPPGWPALLSIAVRFHIDPELVNPFLGLLTLFLLYSFCLRRYGERVAIWSLILVTFNAFFIFNSASFFSHISCALEALLFVHFYYRHQDTGRARFLVLAGFFLGFVAITRYFTAVLIFLPFLISIFYTHRVKGISICWWLGIGSLPCVVFLFIYNYLITGNPLIPVTMWAFDGEGIGFLRGHNLMKGVEHIIRRMGMFMYWSSLFLLIAYVFSLIWKVKRAEERWNHPEDYWFLCLVVGYIFYYEIGGNQYGPRFYFEAFPFLVIFIVRVILPLHEVYARSAFFSVLLVAFVKMAFITGRERLIIQERKDLYKLVLDRGIEDAVIFVSSSTGVIRPMPIGDLTRNDAEFQNSVLFAIDRGADNERLMKYYSGRTFYRYQRSLDRVHGELELLR